MKFSYSWLKSLVDVNLPAEKLAEFLSLHAFETDVANQSQEFPKIIVAKVLKVDKHPNADRLRVVELTDGKNKILPVVCGAWNFEAGAAVALALPGAVIPHDQHDPEGKPFTLGKAKIRGIESQGMICSAKELGLGSEGSGILILDPAKHKLGQTFTVNNDSTDTLFDISVPANRPDLVSYRGVAWEISALTGKKYLNESIKVDETKKFTDKSKFLNVRISDSKLCQRYLAAKLNNVKIGPSSKFIQDRLKSSGIRPINNVVDITNYVMLEIGQPMHAFDAAKVTGAINIRKAYMQESLTTLDGVKRKLTPDMLLVADAKKVLAIAGVMGGMDSSVTEGTTEIILESANFNPVSVRRTSKALGLRTDASSRFEKNLPLELANLGLEYACQLLVKYTGAAIVDKTSAGVKPQKPKQIKFDPEKINSLLGTNISASDQKKILAKFGYKLQGSKFQIPFWRPDVSIWQDLAEEVARFKGLDFIRSAKIAMPPASDLSDTSIDLADKVTDMLVGLGYNELYTYSFVSEQDLKKWHIDKNIAVEVENPLGKDQQFLRPNLALNILKVAERNAVDSENSHSQKYFEIGHIFWREKGEVNEKKYLFMLVTPRSRSSTAELVGDFQKLASKLNINIDIHQHEEQLAQIFVHGRELGKIGTIANTSNLEWIGVSLNFDEFIKHIKPAQYNPINRFPPIDFDTSILVREDLPWSEVKKAILAPKQKLISDIILIEGFYQGKDIPPYKKSVTFRVVYQAPNRTLTREEAGSIHNQILDLLKQKFQASIRD